MNDPHIMLLSFYKRACGSDVVWNLQSKEINEVKTQIVVEA